MTDNDKFDLLAFAKGRSRAKDEVTIYMDEDAAKEADSYIIKKQDKRTQEWTSMGVAPENQDAFDAARERIKQSAVTIHLQGAPEGIVDEIRERNGLRDDSPVADMFASGYVADLLETMHVKSVSAAGDEDTARRTKDEWMEFRSFAPKSQWGKLAAAVINLVFVSNVIDESVDAGFLAKS